MKLIVLDIDGVLALGEAQAFDLTLFQRLATLNRLARRDDSLPSVTLNTGRPSPYVEAVMQAIDAWQPALYESGAGLYSPESYQFQETPLMTKEDKKALNQIVDIVDKAVVQTGKAYWQPGKTICHSLFAISPYTIDDITEEMTVTLAQYSENFIVVPAIVALNIQPKHISKGTGLDWLSQVTGIDMADMAGVGDSMADADFLKLLGYPVAAANATDDVKAVAKYVSPYHAAAGLHDILDYWGV
ncbi:MAG: HAD family hydrolase [Anaerolineae bacterium]|nr:HAD family hydrolase [Anaerolineae bacterium]